MAPSLELSNSTSLDRSSAELGQLLLRLQASLIHASPERERHLRRDEYERAKADKNLEYARNVLTKLELDAMGIKAPARRQEVQSDLNEKRELYEHLVDRMQDIRQMAENDQDQDQDDSESEDILGDLAHITSQGDHIPPSPEPRQGQPPPEPQKSQPPEPATLLPSSEPTSQPDPDPQPSTTATPSAPTQTTQTLRSRSSVQPAPQPAATTTQSSHAAARAALFAGRAKPAAPQTSTATAEAILDRQREEQDELTGSILQMAKALKASSLSFSDTLEADKEVVDRAGEGLSKTERNIEVASGRMGLLRRMTEGKSWWGRMILYAQIYALMVGLVLFVFVFPKLRF